MARQYLQDRRNRQMKKILLLAFASILLVACEKDEKEFSKNETNIIGTWVETYPELFDGVSDTIAFAKDSLINKNNVILFDF